MIKTVLLDMDGVCCDFIRGAHAELYPSCTTFSQPTHWNFYEDWGVSEEFFWKSLQRIGRPFWKNLQPYPQFFKLLQTCGRLGDVYFCTAPSRCPSSASGKLDWLKDRFGKSFNRYILTPHKHLLANSETLLIDDNLPNCKAFIKAGGKAICWPQPWNTGPGDVEHLQQSVLRNLELTAIMAAS